MYTSGSTGHPKGVVSSHRSVMFAPFYWIALQTLLKESSDEENPGIMDEGNQAAVLVSVPLFHVTGSHAIFLLSIPVGRKTVLMHKWDPEVALDLIEREKISDFTGVPTMSYELVEAQKKNPRDISSLKGLNGGGAARPPEQVKEMSENFKDTSPGIGYGLTETEHPSVLEASVFGIPDERLGEKLATVVSCRDDQMIDEIELSGFLASKLAKFKIPEFMKFQTEKLLLIASGKIAKKQLREEAVTTIGK